MKRLPVVLSLALAAVLVTATISYSNTYETIQITANEYDDKDPQINANGQVVWYTEYPVPGSFFSKYSEIFLYDGSTPIPLSNTTHPTADNYKDLSPQISDDGYVVWYGRDRADGQTDEEIFLYDGLNTTQLTDNCNVNDDQCVDDRFPQINTKGDVVWSGYVKYDDGKFEDEIFLYDGSTGAIKQITEKSCNPKCISDRFPQINSNGDAVWRTFYPVPGSWFGLVYHYKSSDQTTISLGSRGLSPQINSNGHVVWYTEYGDLARYYEIFFYNGSLPPTQLTDNDLEDVSPQINDDGYVVWSGRDRTPGQTDHEIFLYDGLTTTQLTNNAFTDNSPQINANGVVVWQGHDGNDFEIFYRRSDGDIIQLTDNSYDDSSPQINDGGETVWSGWDGNDFEIFLAKRMNRSSTADAGSDLAIFSEDQSSTVIQGTAIDPDDDSLTYRWLEGEAVLSEWGNVGPSGEANLDLSTIPNLPVGEHVLRLEVNDGWAVSSAEMVLTVNPNSISSFSLLATNSVWLFRGATVHSGDIGVLNASLHPWFTRRAEVMIGWQSYLKDYVSIYGDSVKIKCGAIVYDVYSNELRSRGTIKGAENTSLELPLDVSLPEFPEPQPGTHDYLIRRGERFTLDPGSYGDIKVRSGASIILTGGTYHLESLKLGHYKAEVLFQGPTELIINNNLRSGVKAFIGPEDSADFGAEAIRIYVNGINGKTRKFCTFPKAVRIGPKNMVRANIYAPNGTVWIRRGSIAEGAFIGKDVRIGDRVHVTKNSAF